MSKKLNIFHIIAGIIILTAMISTLVSGSNNLPYAVIGLYFLSYWLQNINDNRITKILGLINTILLLTWSLLFLMDFVFPFAP